MRIRRSLILIVSVTVRRRSSCRPWFSGLIVGRQRRVVPGGGWDVVRCTAVDGMNVTADRAGIYTISDRQFVLWLVVRSQQVIFAICGARNRPSYYSLNPKIGSKMEYNIKPSKNYSSPLLQPSPKNLR